MGNSTRKTLLDCHFYARGLSRVFLCHFPFFLIANKATCMRIEFSRMMFLEFVKDDGSLLKGITPWWRYFSLFQMASENHQDFSRKLGIGYNWKWSLKNFLMTFIDWALSDIKFFNSDSLFRILTEKCIIKIVQYSEWNLSAQVKQKNL